MAKKVKRQRGAQPSNQNARKHGYYSKVLTPEQQQTVSDAAAVRNLDDEIAVLRVKIATIMKNDPYNYQLLLRALSLLTRMYNSRQNQTVATIPDLPGLEECTGLNSISLSQSLSRARRMEACSNLVELETQFIPPLCKRRGGTRVRSREIQGG